MDFKEWKKVVDTILVSNIGTSSDDLPDARWRDYYDDELNPQQAIDCAFEDAWYGEPLMHEIFYGEPV